MRTTSLAIVLVLVGLSVSARDRAVTPESPFDGARSVMWIAAHPDDEVIVAPLLINLCRDQGLRCTFLVMTRGEAGVCLLLSGCAPDVATVRSSEAAIASRYFRAQSILLDYADGAANANGSAESWDSFAGGHDRLVASMSAFIDAIDPDVVLTFDPRHGSTGHPDHKAIGNVVIEAMRTHQTGRRLLLVETIVTIEENPLRIRFDSSPINGVWEFDANRFLRSIGAESWQATIEDMRIHRSQFDDSWIQSVADVEPSHRKVWIAASPQ